MPCRCSIPFALFAALIGVSCSRSAGEIVFRANDPAGGLYVVGERPTEPTKSDGRTQITFGADHLAFVTSLDVLTGSHSLSFLDSDGNQLPLGVKGVTASRKDVAYFWPLFMATDSYWLFVGTPAEYDALQVSGMRTVGEYSSNFTP